MLKITGPINQLKAIAQTFSKMKRVSFEFTEDESSEVEERPSQLDEEMPNPNVVPASMGIPKKGKGKK